jgi:hypothetical protein
MQLSPTTCHFIPLRSKYSSKHPVLKYPQFISEYGKIKLKWIFKKKYVRCGLDLG